MSPIRSGERVAQLRDEAARRRKLDLLQSFEPWGDQKPFIESQARYAFLAGGNKAGKTYGFAAFFAKQLRGLGHFQHPIDAWYVSRDWETVGEGWIELRKFLPPWEIARIEWERTDRIPRYLRTKSGSRCTFKSAEAGASAMQSGNLHLVGVDEEIPEDIWQELRRRLAQPGAIFRMAATWNKGYAWARMLYDGHQDPGHPGYVPGVEFYRLNVLDSPYATEEYKADARTLTGEEYRARTEGFFKNPSGLVCARWDDRVHLCDRFDVPAHWALVRGIDFGWRNPTAFIWWAFDPYGKTYLVGCYGRAELTPAEAVAGALEYEREQGFPRPIATWMDPACEARDPQTGKSMQEQFLSAGMPVYPAPRLAEEDFYVWFNQQLTRRDDAGLGLVQVFRDCREWLLERQHFVWKDGKADTNFPERTQDKMDNYMDAGRYGLTAYMSAPPEIRIAPDASERRTADIRKQRRKRRMI